MLSWSTAIYAKEHAGTKKQASNGLALQLVSQLYHLGIIEAHRAPGEKKKINQVTMVTLDAGFSCNFFENLDDLKNKLIFSYWLNTAPTIVTAVVALEALGNGCLVD